MAIYVPASARRRNTIIIAAVALAAGIVLGLGAGRATAPSVSDRVSAVQDHARAAASQLRVIALHEDADVAGRANGTLLALQRARAELVRALHAAPWISRAEREQLLAEDERLTEHADEAQIERVAKHIDGAFGLSG